MTTTQTTFDSANPDGATLDRATLASSEETWVSTVRTDRNSAAAISALD